MLSLDNEEDTPIAKLKITKAGSKKTKIVILGVSNHFDVKKGMKTKTTYETNHKLIPVPDMEKRFTEYVAGPSGSGKSYMTAGLAREWQHVHPEKSVYIFSRGNIDDDPAFEGLDYVQIPINEDLLDDPVDIVQMAEENGIGCLFIFDDCGTIHNEKIKKEVEKLIADILEVGRKYDVNIIVTNHLIIPNEKKFGRTILNELSVITLYPKCGSVQQIKYVLKTYWGLQTKQIDQIISLNSRWVRISKSYPQYVLYEHGAYFL